MSVVFADTYYFLALLNPDDEGHTRAIHFAGAFKGRMITTGWVLIEVADAMSHPTNRALVVDFLGELRADRSTTIEPLGDALSAEGLRLFASRPDKHWTLTDCISIVVMQREGIAEALTADHHFEQAGFRALLKA